ncbi:hypothetical protein BYT27DRAFT_7225274 [Phlegmacium glaucopus]|nr:hypothetical protein BYT27DRAFT_7225274 [Phlegmacium glaucopus]
MPQVGLDNSKTPPGIDDVQNLEYYASGGDENEWLCFSKKRYYTNAFIVEDGKLLLGLKKRGVGKDKQIHHWVFSGGKVEPGETPLEAAGRELEEEAGIRAPLEHGGSLLFFSEGSEWAFQIEIYRANSYEGTVTESDEMKPEWFSLSPPNDGSVVVAAGNLPPIPFSQMWETDHVWLPLLISKRKFIGRADFIQSGAELKPYKWWYGVITAN